MHPWLYVALILGIFIFGTFILVKLRVSSFFVVTFLFLGLIYASAPLWERLIPFITMDAGTIWSYWVYLWGFTFVLVDVSFITALAVYQRKVLHRLYLEPIVVLAIFLIGIRLLVGTWLGDFGYFLIEGQHLFNPVDAPWLIPWIGPLPWYYWIGTLIGVPCFIIGIGWAIWHPEAKHKGTQYRACVTLPNPPPECKKYGY